MTQFLCLYFWIILRHAWPANIHRKARGRERERERGREGEGDRTTIGFIP